jgi:NAD(P)-dependent dehydrogenase (short-subunit alcohol dehydrogenase family)
MSMNISDQVAVVTGGGSGIGRGIGLALAAAGADVVVADINLENAQAVAEEIKALGRRAEAFKCDVTSEADVERLADFAWAQMGRVELVFNNAGVVAAGMAVDASAKDLLWTYNVNAFGVWYGTVAFTRRFIAQGVRGWICNTASENGIGVASIGTAIYTSAKHAVLGMTDAFRMEYQGKVGYSVLCPGIVKTNIWDAGRNRPEEYGGEFSGNPINQKAIGFGMSAERVGTHVVESVGKEEFYIFTHPHVRDIAEQRWKEIAAAMDRQWPEGAGEDQLNTLDVQRKLMEGLQAETH